MLESLACGCPIVTSNVGGIPDAVRHDTNGFLAQVGDAEGYAEGLAFVLGDVDRRARLSDAARRSAEESYSDRLQAQRFLDLYGELVERRATA